MTASRWLRAAALLLVGLGLLTVVLTQQRGAWLAVVAQLVAVPVLLARPAPGARRRWAVLGLVLVLVVGAGTVWYLRPDVVAPVTDRLAELTADLSGRPALWGAAAELTRMRPLVGWGIGSFGTAYDTLHPPGSRQAWRFRGTAHNLYLHVLAERGVLGLLALVALGWAMTSGLREVSRRPSDRDAPLATGLLVALVGVAIYGLAQYVLYLKNIELLAWMLLAAGSLLMAGAPPSGARRLAQGVMVGALVLLPFRGWVTEPMAPRQDHQYGFHELERKPGRVLTWVEGRAARRLQWKGDVLRVDIVDGHPKAGARPVEVVMTIDGVEVWRGEAPSEWRTIELEAGPPTAEFVTWGISVQPTFRPFSDYLDDPDLESSRDIRELGVAVSRLSWAER